jgi:hypothetical protein
LNTINQAVTTINYKSPVNQILNTVQSIQSILGSTSNTATNNTVFGNIMNVENLIGNSTTNATGTLFGSLSGANSYPVQAANNAAAAMSEAQQIITDLGVNGATPNMYAKLKNLEDDIQDIQTSTTNLVTGINNTSGLAQASTEKLTQFINQQAQQAGLQKTLGVASLSSKEAKDMEKVNDKLEEIKAKIDALREALNVQDVVVKSYYESE